jgi:glutamyl-tRNA reductase
LSSTVTPLASTKSWFLGTGRRKESIARVFLRAGSGKFTVNGRTAENYFPNHAWKHDALEPLKFTNLADQVDVVMAAALADKPAQYAWDWRARFRATTRSCGPLCAPTVF